MNSLLADIGATHSRFARTDGQRIIQVMKIRTLPDWRSGKAMISSVAKTLFGTKKIKAAVIGLPGRLDVTHARLLEAPNLKSWARKSIKHELQQVLQTKVRLENDTTLGGLGEARWGAGRKHRIVAFLAIGTGVGGARIVDRQADESSYGFEPGQQVIHNRRTLEWHVGGRWLSRRYHQHWPKLTTAEWRRTAGDLSVGLVNIIRLWSPEVIVLGGGVMENGGLRVSEIQRHVRRLLPNNHPVPPIRKSALGDRAGIMGALALAKEFR